MTNNNNNNIGKARCLYNSDSDNNNISETKNINSETLFKMAAIAICLHLLFNE